MKKTIKKDRKYVKILGINIVSTTKEEVLASVKDFISHNKKFYIVTPNPELVLASQTNPKLKSALNDADLAIPDGVGLRVAEPGLNIIKGRELFLDLTKLAKDNNWKVFLLGGMGMEAELAAKKLGVSYAKGPILDQNTQPVTEVDKELLKDAVDRINKTSPDLLFVAFGNPKQEIWIHENLSKLNVGGAMAVGGTFRYVAGLSKLPPKWMEELGLEWIWRLITEPYRFGRVFQALVVFPLKVFWYRVANS